MFIDPLRPICRLALRFRLVATRAPLMIGEVKLSPFKSGAVSKTSPNRFLASSISNSNLEY
jgi:hypothetical protein